MDRREEEDFPRPEVPIWDVFEDAAAKLFYNWDVSIVFFRLCFSFTI